MGINAIILSAIGSLIIILLTIVGYFVKHWMDTTDKREDRNMGVIKDINQSILVLNTTLVKINTGMEVFEASATGSFTNIISDIAKTERNIDCHEKKLNDHEVRLTVIEKTKIR